MEHRSHDNKESPWDFKSARQFLLSYNLSPSNTVVLKDDSIPDPERYNSKSQAPKGLGDFDRLFAFVGKHTIISQRRRSNESSSARREDSSTPPSSAPDETVRFEDFVQSKEVRWTDQEGISDLAQVRRRTTRGSTNGNLDPSVVAQLLEETDLSDLESDTGDEATSLQPTFNISIHSASFTATKLPAHSKPPGPINPYELADPTIIKPYYTLTANEQKAKLAKKLAKIFVNEAQLLKNPQNILRKGGNVHSQGIHVFVDLSNIVIGFAERIRINRVKAGLLRDGAHTKQPPFSFHSLALILERGRPVCRRVMVGSTSSIAWNPNGHKLPDHVLEGEMLGYEPNILERVNKPHRIPTRKKKGGTGSGYATGYSSTSETPTSGRMKMQEQAVDELLQMKMLESLVDFEPSTLILASGDAAEAEYSGGFLKTVERALTRGWKVEVMAWCKGLSYEYQSTGLAMKWKGRLSIIELDDFCEEMLAIYTQKYVSNVFA